MNYSSGKRCGKRAAYEALVRLLTCGDLRAVCRVWDLRDEGKVTESELDEARRIANARTDLAARYEATS